MRVLGIMSGTSIDGVDYALCDVERRSVRLIKLCGGRAKNRTLIGRIESALRASALSVSLFTSEDIVWQIQAIEPAAFALLAYYRWREWPANFPATTGASRLVLLGELTT